MKVFVIALGKDSLETSIKSNILCPATSEIPIKALSTHDVNDLLATPKFLLPVGTRPALSWLFEHLEAMKLLSSTYIVTDAVNFKAVERWSMFAGISADHILNVGTVEETKYGLCFFFSNRHIF